MKAQRQIASCFLILALHTFPVLAQAPGEPGAGGAGGGRGGGRGRGGASAYPSRAPADPALVEKGRANYSVNCAFCHGSDARGGEGGPNLIRSEIVLRDVNGEGIGPVVRDGRVNAGMPKFPMEAAQISELAAFLHSFPVSSRETGRVPPASILTGDAKKGETYFQTTCGSCHSATGDLKGIAGRVNDPRALQQRWLMPGGGGRGGGNQSASSPVTVTVTLANGQKYNGRLSRLDDFLVSLVEADGTVRTFASRGDVPKVEIHDPLAPHKSLLPRYKDDDIHNVTAYLATLK